MRKPNAIVARAALAATTAALGVGAAVTACGAPTPPAAAPAAAGSPADSAGPGYTWYRSMMNGYSGSGGMMGSSNRWMMSQAGYQWMTGETSAPGWMRGGSLPPMMGTGTDPGTIMGRLFADAPGPRIDSAHAQRLGSQVPSEASIDRAARTITFTTTNVNLIVLASPSMPAESFRIAGMTNPAIIVPRGAHVSIELVNADPDMAHGLVVMPAGAARSSMPMMTAAPVFSGAALWFLGEPTDAGMHAGTFAFTTTRAGRYQYLCPVPGHARAGMNGAFTVR